VGGQNFTEAEVKQLLGLLAEDGVVKTGAGSFNVADGSTVEKRIGGVASWQQMG